MTKKGFTFIELFIITIIIGVLAAVSIPRFKAQFESFRINNFAKEIYYLTNYLESSALAKRLPYCFKINFKENSLNSFYLKDGELCALREKIAKPLKAPEDISISTQPENLDTIFFYPDGTSETAELIIKNKPQEIHLIINNGKIKIE